MCGLKQSWGKTGFILSGTKRRNSIVSGELELDREFLLLKVEWQLHLINQRDFKQLKSLLGKVAICYSLKRASFVPLGH